MDRKIIADWLVKNDKSQVWLSKETEIRQSHLSEFLSGKKDLGLDNIVAICKVTKIDLNELVGLKPFLPDVTLKMSNEGIQLQDTRISSWGKVKIRIHGYIDAEVVPANSKE